MSQHRRLIPKKICINFFFILSLLRDTLLLRIDFNDNITDVFKYFINAISQFVGAQHQDTKDLYFLERTLADCSTKGRFL